MVHGHVSEYEADRARVAWEAYSADLGGVDPITGARLREWGGVPTVVKRAFMAAVEAARTFDTRPTEDDEAPVDEVEDDGLDGMSASELRAYAASELQLSLPASASKSAMRASIRDERTRAAREE